MQMSQILTQNQNKLFKILFILLLLRYTTQNKLEQKYMRVVDTIQGPYEQSGKFNVIFRSNIPEDETGTKFEYDKLVDYMVKVAKAERRLRIEKDNIYIIDFTLLQMDDPKRKTEEKFWDENPKKGKLMGWSVKGERKNPEDYSTEEIIRTTKYLSWMRDDIDRWVDEIHTAATSFRNDSMNVMLLVHCNHGRDRAGEINGAYQLKYGGKTWQEVIATNYRMYSAHIKYENHRALTWYCYHLQYHRNYTHLQCTNENLSTNSKKVPSLVGWDIEGDDDSTAWMIAFFSLLASSILGLFAFLIVIIIIFGLFLARGFIRRKMDDVGAKFKKLRGGSSDVLDDDDDTANQIHSKIDDAGDLGSI